MPQRSSDVVGVLVGCDASVSKSPAAIATDAVPEHVVAVSIISQKSAVSAPARRSIILNFLPDAAEPGAVSARQFISVAVPDATANICAIPSVDALMGESIPAKRLDDALGEGMPVSHQSVAHAGDADKVATIMMDRILLSIFPPMMKATMSRWI